MDQIKQMLNQLQEMPDEQVSELQSQIIGEFEAVEKEDPSPQTVDAMTSLADMLDSVRTEMKQREAAAKELAQQAAEAASRVYGEGDSEEEEMMADPEAPMEETEEEVAGMDSDSKDKEDKEMAMDKEPMEEEEEKAAAPEEEEMAEETETSEEMPPSEDEEEKAKMSTKLKKASADEEKTTELSIEETPTSEAPAEEAVTASGEEEAPEEEPVTAEEAPEEEEPVSSESDETAEEDGEGDGEAEASVEPEATTEAAVETKETPTEPSAQETMEAPVTAAAENADNLEIEVPADRRPVAQVSAAPVAITAGADIPGYTAGSTLESMDTVAEAMAKRIHSLRRVNGGDGEQHIVASLTTSFPEERTLSTDAEENWDKIQNVTGPEAIVAAGGHQAPFEARYDIFGFGTTNRPVRDALPRFQADRGGIRFITPPELSEFPGAVGVWTAANDAAQTPDPAAKNTLVVAAASENTVATDAVTLQLQFGNLATRAYPELIARHNELGLIQHAREAEQELLSKIATDSTAVTSTSLIGVGRDLLVQVGRAATAYRSRHRLEADAPLRVILPSWVKDAMAADLALSMPGDSLLNAYSEIEGYLSARGVVVSYSLDQNVYGAQGASALLEFADSFTWYMFAEGTFLFLDGGTLDLGIIRDSSLVGTNDYKMFIETFEGVAKVGIESLAITSTIQVNGAAAALRDTLGGVASATIEY